MNNTRTSSLFYLGTLISSVGSFAFNLCLIAFMIQNGFTLANASLILGLQRLVPIIVTGIIGHYSDRIPPRTTVVIAEAIATVASLVLLVLWNGPSTPYLYFSVVCVLRAVVVGFQMGSRAKIAKLLSDDTFVSNSRQAIWFNKATQGATLFGGLLAWVIIKNFTFETAIIVDGVTYFVSGILIWLMPKVQDTEDITLPANESWTAKFHSLFEFNKRAATLDLLLAVSMMGTVAFMARVAKSDQSWAALFLASYGVAVWAAGFLERGVTTKLSSAPFWILLGVCFAALGQFTEPGWLTLAVFFVKDFSYWVIFHRISSHIQMDTPKSKIGSVFSARTSIMISILALGEIAVGAWSQVVPLSFEGIGRGAVAVLVAVLLFTSSRRRESNDDRPIL